MVAKTNWIPRIGALTFAVGLGAGCSGDDGGAGASAASSAAADTREHDGHHHGRHRVNEFTVNRLVSDDTTVIPADFADANLKNAWGLAAGPTTPWWVANNATGTSTLYDAAGHKQALTVTVPGDPTGLVFNGGTGFPVTSGTATGAARFIFASEDGTIAAWSPAVPPPPPSTNAFVVVPDAGHGAVYKGLAIATTTGGDRVYATDFHNNRVDVFDSQWNAVSLPADAFHDDHLPAGYAPFGIRALNGMIVVTYALQDADAHDDVAGRGHGFVDAYDTAGALLYRIATHDDLDSPWGLAIAPGDFGPFGGMLLVGNFGDGRIHAFDLSRCHHRGCHEAGALETEHHSEVVIDGLWALDFGKGNANSGNTQDLYFTSGPNGEANGLFGFIAPEDDDRDDHHEWHR